MKAAGEQPRFACVPFRGGWQGMHARGQALLTSVETSERWMSPTVCDCRAANSSPMASMSSSVISGLMLLTVRVAYFVAPVAVAPFSTLILRVVVTSMRCVAIRHPPFVGLLQSPYMDSWYRAPAAGRWGMQRTVVFQRTSRRKAGWEVFVGGKTLPWFHYTELTCQKEALFVLIYIYIYYINVSRYPFSQLR